MVRYGRRYIYRTRGEGGLKRCGRRGTMAPQEGIGDVFKILSSVMDCMTILRGVAFKILDDV